MPDVLLERRGRVALLTLNRPERLNAFAAATARCLWPLLDEVAADDEIRVLVLTGAGRGFCSGADLKALGSGDTDWGSRRAMIDVPARLQALPQISIAAVNGVAAGAGFGIALGCDLRIASEDASFLAAQIKTAQVPDAGLTYFLPRLVGVERALRIALGGRPIPAREALELGLVGEVVAPDVLLERALALADEIARGPRLATRLTRRAIQHGASSTLEEALEEEYRALIEAHGDPDTSEAIRAFVEKRPPRFR